MSLVNGKLVSGTLLPIRELIMNWILQRWLLICSQHKISFTLPLKKTLQMYKKISFSPNGICSLISISNFLSFLLVMSLKCSHLEPFATEISKSTYFTLLKSINSFGIPYLISIIKLSMHL